MSGAAAKHLASGQSLEGAVARGFVPPRRTRREVTTRRVWPLGDQDQMCPPDLAYRLKGYDGGVRRCRSHSLGG